jgi:hypothetical protein
VSAVTGEGEGEPERRASVYGDGIGFMPWSLLWLLGGVVAIVSVGYDIFVLTADVRPAWLGDVWRDGILGRDFTNLWTAGRLVLAHAPACPFELSCFRAAFEHELQIPTHQNYSYPPTALFIAVPFGLFPYFLALVFWTVFGACFFAWAARPFLPKGFPLYLAVLTPAATINVWNGHYGFLLGGLWLLFFRSLEGRPAVAGLVAGLLTFKPHMGIMIALSSVRARSTIVFAVIMATALALLSAGIFGLDTWRSFFLDTTREQGDILTRDVFQFYFRQMPSAYVQFDRGLGGLIAQLIFAVGAVALLLKYRHWDAFSAATATFLIVPYCFNYDMTVACLGFAILLFERWSSLRPMQRVSLLTAFFAPELTYFAGAIVPFALLGALQVQLKLATVSNEADEGNVSASEACKPIAALRTKAA